MLWLKELQSSIPHTCVTYKEKASFMCHVLQKHGTSFHKDVLTQQQASAILCDVFVSHRGYTYESQHTEICNKTE